MNVVIQLAGAVLVIVTLVDVYLTVLQGGSVSLISAWAARGIWLVFRGVGKRLGRRKNRLLSYAGPTLVPALILMWVTLLSVGFALIHLPVMGTRIVASSGESPAGFWSALYYSQMSLVTLGTGDLTATTDGYRLLSTFIAITGFSIVTASITYLLSVYNSLIRHNSFALSLHRGSDDTGDAAEFIARLGAGGSFNTSQTSLSLFANELSAVVQSHHIYVVLRYFRGSTPAYGLPRVAMMIMNTTSLIRSALDQDRFRALTLSTTTTQLWKGGLHLLTSLEPSLVPEKLVERYVSEPDNEQAWRAYYRRSVQRFQAEGIATATDPEAGEEHYVELRRIWQPHISAFADYLQYDRQEICPGEQEK
jgi:hypothetical protein